MSPKLNRKTDPHNSYHLALHAAWPKDSSLMHDTAEEITKRTKNVAIMSVGFWVSDLVQNGRPRRVRA